MIGKKRIRANNKAHRLEIDGLRAIAVLAVVFYHLDSTLVPGGFLGVDVFFVISGFLIAKSIFADIDAERFTLLSFYERRARRLAAPFLLVVGVSTIFGYALLMPDDYSAFGSSAVSALLLHSNHYFFGVSGYFSPDAHSKPLLHFWSLSVEEQFYLVFPVMTLVVARWCGSHLFPIFGALAGLSFALCVFVVPNQPDMAFFLIPFRAWELLLGVLLAIALRQDRIRVTDVAKEACSAIGVVLVLWSIVFFTSDTTHPGFPTLIPCIGTALVIFGDSERKTIPGLVLSAAPMVGLGRLSYALYLWHWPVICFVVYYLGRSLTVPEQMAVFAGSILLSILTLEFIENPARFRKTRIFTGETIAATIVVISAASVTNLAIHRSGGLPQRVDPEVRRMADARSDWTPDQFTCADPDPSEIRTGDICRYTTSGATGLRVLLWGDLYATALLPPMVDLTDSDGYELTFVATNGCPPILDLETEKGNCAEANDAVRDLMKNEAFDLLVMAANWRSYGRDNPVSFRTYEEDATEEGIGAGLSTTLAYSLTQTTSVLVVGQVPSYVVDVPMYLARASFFAPIDQLIGTRRRLPTAQWEVEYVHIAASEAGVDVLDPSEFLCTNGLCRMMQDELVLYKDRGHLSSRGSQAIMGEPLRNAISRLAGH
ncbi:acyltransferase family protein [Ahrensia marina]|uniref:acyltransferase family protein n=1 Tax=Ahrensia marina TaxID=1514904 RepID=UPI0035D00B27